MAQHSQLVTVQRARGARLVLHAAMTNFYWIIITACVSALVALALEFRQLWREQPGEELIVYSALTVVVLSLVIAYCQRKARWLVADRRGITVTERSRERLVPWSDVRSLMDLGSIGSGPGARRHYIEFSDGEGFTFLADPDAMKRLDQFRDEWGISASR